MHQPREQSAEDGEGDDAGGDDAAESAAGDQGLSLDESGPGGAAAGEEGGVSQSAGTAGGASAAAATAAAAGNEGGQRTWPGLGDGPSVRLFLGPAAAFRASIAGRSATGGDPGAAIGRVALCQALLLPPPPAKPASGAAAPAAAELSVPAASILPSYLLYSSARQDPPPEVVSRSYAAAAEMGPGVAADPETLLLERQLESCAKPSPSIHAHPGQKRPSLCPAAVTAVTRLTPAAT